MLLQCTYENLGGFMSITKKLTRHGNSYAIVIDRPILELLGITDDSLLELSTPDGSTIVITPVKSKVKKKKFKDALQEINKKYARALKNLAE